MSVNIFVQKPLHSRWKLLRQTDMLPEHLRVRLACRNEPDDISVSEIAGKLPHLYLSLQDGHLVISTEPQLSFVVYFHISRKIRCRLSYQRKKRCMLFIVPSVPFKFWSVKNILYLSGSHHRC